MDIKAIYTKAVGWYFGLPWWKKALFFLALIGLLVLAILYLVYRYFSDQNMTPTTPVAVDAAHTAVVDQAITENRKEQRKLEADLLLKKSEAMGLAQTRVHDAAKQREVRDAISNAKSFEEVDAAIKAMKR
jgi:uncharacterized membrane protein YhiD involved in acid resistance